MIPPVVEVRYLEMTCDYCPAQWVGRTEGGRAVYVRYRSGTLQVGTGDTLDAAIDAAMSPDNPDTWGLGDRWDGSLTYEGLIEATRGRFAWPIEPAR